MNSKMRRGLSISMILLLWLGPLAAILPAGAEARLPLCCRRNGAHHCAMSAQGSAVAPISGAERVLTAPLKCSSFPGFAPASTAAFALSHSPLQALHAEAIPPGTISTADPVSQPHTRAGRGPPALS